MPEEYDLRAIKVDSNTTTKQANTSNDQSIMGDTSSNIVHDDLPLSPDEEELLKKLNAPEKVGGSTASSSAKQNTKETKIQQVPAMLRREHFDKYFKPRAIVVGPQNLSSETLFGEELKIKLAAKFIDISHRATLVEKTDEVKSDEKGMLAKTLYRRIKKDIENLKKCFDQAVFPDSDEKLALMLFTDGCAILQFIYSCARGDLKVFNINNGQAALIQQDLFLLENQIPYRVLKLLMEPSSGEHNSLKELIKESIKDFIRLNVMSPAKYSEKIPIDLDTKDPVHLLDLLRSALLQEDDNDHDHRKDLTKCQTEYELSPLLSPVLQEEDNNHDHDYRKDLTRCQTEYKRTFRNIQDLKAAGIEVEPSETCSLRDVSFSSFCFAGCLRLPPLIVDDSTARKLLNLVAFEMCPDKFQTDDGVTSYVYFLDSLIDNEEDAKDLRMATIFRNRLSSDAEVANIFNEIGTDLVPAPAYIDVKKKIQKHCDNRCMIWVAQVYRDHFSSPWTILALIAAVIVLGLTGVQTWFTILPR